MHVWHGNIGSVEVVAAAVGGHGVETVERRDIYGVLRRGRAPCLLLCQRHSTVVGRVQPAQLQTATCPPYLDVSLLSPVLAQHSRSGEEGTCQVLYILAGGAKCVGRVVRPSGVLIVS